MGYDGQRMWGGGRRPCPWRGGLVERASIGDDENGRDERGREEQEAARLDDGEGNWGPGEHACETRRLRHPILRARIFLVDHAASTSSTLLLRHHRLCCFDVVDSTTFTRIF